MVTTVAALEAELAQARTSVGELDARRRALEAEVELTQTAGPEAAPRGPALDAFDPEPVGRAVAEAAGAASRLAASLADAARALGVDTTIMDGSPTAAPERGNEAPHAVAPRSRPPRRQPAKLPPAVLDDSPEAAAHLMRIGGAILLVDGYNATLSTWPGLSLIEQRHRLIDALAELSARTGVEPVVVFDGDEQAMSRPGQSRRPVKVRFTHADVEADDVILDLVTEVALHRPVIVASDDRRVRDGAHDRGANVVSNDQLFSALGRQR
jgi:predicted RNA-binding protein with PIN domain